MRRNWKKSPGSEDDDRAEAVGGGVSMCRLICWEDSDLSSGLKDNWRENRSCQRPRQKGQKSSRPDTQRGVNERSPSQCSCQLLGHC